jgi:RNA polymerase sigma-70 factor (ECF subfamily)
MTSDDSKNLGRDLMLKVSRGDERAFEGLVTIFQKQVLNTIYRYLGDAALAEDLSQEVFMKIYQARKRYKPLARFETWLHRIVYNVVVNEAHSRRRRKAVSLDAFRGDGMEDGDFIAGGIADPITQLKEQELHRMVREAVLDLPPNQRMALVLNKFQDMSYQEVAEAQNTSVEAVKSMLFRAREKIKTKLRPYVKSEVCDERDT